MILTIFFIVSFFMVLLGYRKYEPIDENYMKEASKELGEEFLDEMIIVEAEDTDGYKEKKELTRRECIRDLKVDFWSKPKPMGWLPSVFAFLGSLGLCISFFWFILTL